MHLFCREYSVTHELLCVIQIGIERVIGTVVLEKIIYVHIGFLIENRLVRRLVSDATVEHKK